MNWINFFFFVIVLNTLTGTVAYLLCKLLALAAKKCNAIRIIYPLYRLVLLFYIVPLGYIYIRCKWFVRFGAVTIGDGFLGNSKIHFLIQICLIAWIIGMICIGLRYMKKWKQYRKICRNNLPFRGDKYRAILERLYPHKSWKCVSFCTNYMVDSPCVMGVFQQIIAFRTLDYSIEDIELVLMHEGTHIVRLDNLGKKVALIIVLVNWFNPILRFYLDDLDAWGDISCDIHVCSRFLGGHARKYFDLLLKFSQEEKRSEELPAFVSQLNSEQSLGKRVEYMIRWQKAGKKTGASVLLALALVIGSSVTAFASSAQVASQQSDLYRETRVQEVGTLEEDDLQEYVIPADQVDEEKWDNAVVYGNDALDPLSVQKNFDWKVPGNNFARSGAFIKKAGSTIIVSCYVYDDRYHHVGIRRPDGSMLYVNGMHQVTKTFNCETTGTYYVYVENMRSTEIRAAGYFIR